MHASAEGIAPLRVAGVALTRAPRQTLPRRPGDRARGSGTFVMRNGVLVEGAGATAAAVSPLCHSADAACVAGESIGDRVATGILDMGEARSRHAALLKRQYFGACERSCYICVSASS